MEKKKLGVIFGGMSTENQVSVVSADSILSHLDQRKYEIYPIYIKEDGTWWKYTKEKRSLNFGESIQAKEKIENVFSYLRNLDVIFPVLHGLYGEDGTIQGLFELIKVPYVGCHVLASSIGMDKIYSKMIFEKAGLKQAKCEYIQKRKDHYVWINHEFEETALPLEEIAKKIIDDLSFPMFVKPSNSGSSVGIKKAKNEKELQEAIQYASKFDKKILIEEGLIGKEVECAVLGNDEVIASCVGEIFSADEFYSYDAKYNNTQSKTKIPAEISKETEEEIRKQAVKAFKAIDGKGLARVDFFVTDKGVYINEVNTLPGFTSISMYPKLFAESGISYADLLDRLIELALEK